MIICYIPMLTGQSDEVRRWTEGVRDRFGVIPVLLPPVRWNDDLTPWPADPIFRKGKPFGGKAEAYLHTLETDIIPSLESVPNPAGSGIVPAERWFVGVSLAGLFGIWAAARSPLFTRVAAVSGSFWYPGFTQWLAGQSLQTRSVYLSLGDREADSKNPQLRDVAAQTHAVARIIGEQGVPVDFEWTAGTHFGPILPRLDKAVAALSVHSGRADPQRGPGGRP